MSALSPTQEADPAPLGWAGGASGAGGSAGMFPVPSEPGYYQDGEFGIRIEDVALVVEAQTEVGQWGWGDRGGTPWGPALRGVGATPRAWGIPKDTSLWQHQSGEEPFLTFEVVSLVPYDRNLIDLSLLSPEQVQGCARGGEHSRDGGQHRGLGSGCSNKIGP